jgi:hypothetical protein
MLVPLIGGYYQARSTLANAQRCLNLYPEINPKDSPTPVTDFPTPGLTLLRQGPFQLPWRGLYTATNGVLYGVLGGTVYLVNTDWSLTQLGIIPTKFTPVSMVDNGTVLVLVDGSNSGWSVTLVNNAFATITAANFQGGDVVTYIDTFFIFNIPGTKQFYTSLSGTLTFDPTYVGAKVSFADPLVTLAAMHDELWLLGSQTTEIWGNAGISGQPFQKLSGVFIQHGIVAKYSSARYNLQLFWLSQDEKGSALVLMGTNYQVKNITTPAVADQLRQYPSVADAIGMTYQQGAHVFYIISFPTANKTWVYDLSTDLWHERAYIDLNGAEGRIRANCTAFAYGRNVCGDWQNGNLYAFDLENGTDNGQPIARRRGFPHAVKDGHLVFHSQFIAYMDTGTALAGVGEPTQAPDNAGVNDPALEPEVSIRWSDDGGKSWGEPITVSMGASGEYSHNISIRDLGQSRDRVYEIFWSDFAPAALNGAWVDMVELPV